MVNKKNILNLDKKQKIGRKIAHKKYFLKSENYLMPTAGQLARQDKEETTDRTHNTTRPADC